MDKKGLTYQRAGVDPEKAGQILSAFAAFQKSRPKDPNVLSGIGPFAACYALAPALSKLEEPILVTSCDGVGTKLKLALDWNRLEDLGQDLVGMNVNDLLCVGARPMIFLDYFSCGSLKEKQLTTLLKSIQMACEASSCALVGGETAEMPGLYQNDDFDLAGFTMGLVDRKNILGAEKVKHGDVLLALASSGPHSNGYSLIRKIIEQENISPESKPPFETTRTWREILLAPTQLYVEALGDVLPDLHALAHLTGGGLFENLPRVLPISSVAHIHAHAWKMPPLFQWLQEKAAISTNDLLSTFNCGVGMIAICSSEKASKIISHVAEHKIVAWEIGQIEMTTESKPASVSWK